MKNLIKSVVMACGALALIAACEPAGGSETKTTGTTATDQSDAVDAVDADGTDAVDGGVDDYPAIKIVDNRNNTTLQNDGDAGPPYSPGADIDAAELVSGSDVVGTLTNCSLTDTMGFKNDNDSTGDAEGGPDYTSGEPAGQYVSLNGGEMLCAWTGGGTISSGDDQEVIVYEIGNQPEGYGVHVCKSTGGNCLKAQNYATGEGRFPTSALF